MGKLLLNRWDSLFPRYDKEMGGIIFHDPMGYPLSYEEHLQIKAMLDESLLNNKNNFKQSIEEETEEFNNKYLYGNKPSTEKVKRERKVIQGYVYIIKIDNHFKIGKAKDMKGRMGEYTKLPIEPKIVFLKKVNDHTLAEETLHRYFADKRGRGEWFNLDDEDIKKAKQLV